MPPNPRYTTDCGSGDVRHQALTKKPRTRPFDRFPLGLHSRCRSVVAPATHQTAVSAAANLALTAKICFPRVRSPEGKKSCGAAVSAGLGGGVVVGCAGDCKCIYHPMKSSSHYSQPRYQAVPSIIPQWLTIWPYGITMSFSLSMRLHLHVLQVRCIELQFAVADQLWGAVPHIHSGFFILDIEIVNGLQ